MTLTLGDLRRAANDAVSSPYKRGEGQRLPQRSGGGSARRRAGKKSAAAAYHQQLALVGLPPPLPKPKDVKARSKDANREAALALLRDTSDDEGASDAPHAATGSNAVLRAERTFPVPTADHLPSDAPAELAPCALRRSSTQPPASELSDDDSVGPAEVSLPAYNVPAKHLRNLEHSGRGDQEDEWRAQNHHLLLGQGAAKNAHGEAGCDIPMLRTSSSLVPTVCLDPDLPPLAAEHPARVWNAMLHALAPDLQPIIRWEYDDVMLSGEWAYVARMTLILPPTHPAITSHSAAKALPKNRYVPAYRAAMEVLGGVKSWVGPPRKLKADAQNTTITICIAENALDWVLAPAMLPVPEEGELSPAEQLLKDLQDLGADAASGVSASMNIEHDEAVDVYGCQLTITAHSAGPDGSPLLQQYVVECVHPTPEAAQTAACQLALDLNVRGFLDWVKKSGARTDVASSGGSTSSEPASSALSDPFDMARCVVDASQSPASAPQAQPFANAEIKPALLVTSDDSVDWQVQLAYFCHASGLAPPVYSQKIARRPGLPTLFMGKVTVDGEPFESAWVLQKVRSSTDARSSHDNLGAARQAVARDVFAEHFGQEAVRVADMPPTFRP